MIRFFGLLLVTMFSIMSGVVLAQVEPDVPVGCTALNERDEMVFIYAAPNDQSVAIGALLSDQSIPVTIGSSDAWLQVSANVVGWVRQDDVAVTENCDSIWRLQAEQPDVIYQPANVTLNSPVANMRTGPALTFERLGQLTGEETFSALGQSDDLLPWILLRHPQQGLVWVRSDLLTLQPEDVHLPVIDVPEEVVIDLPEEFAPQPDTDIDMPVQQPANPPPPPPSNNTGIVSGAWIHDSRLVEHGCTMPGAPQVGDVTTIGLTLNVAPDESAVTITYPSGFSFQLAKQGGTRFAGSYGSAATIYVDLTFTSNTSYNARENIVHESGCIVRSEWSGRAR